MILKWISTRVKHKISKYKTIRKDSPCTLKTFVTILTILTLCIAYLAFFAQQLVLNFSYSPFNFFYASWMWAAEYFMKK